MKREKEIVSMEAAFFQKCLEFCLTLFGLVTVCLNWLGNTTLSGTTNK